MDQRLHTAGKECHVPAGDPLTLSEETNGAPVSLFNLDSADSIPREDGIAKKISLLPTTSTNRGVYIDSPPITQLPNYTSSDSADGIPREDEFSIKVSENGGRDIRSRSPVKHPPHYSRGKPNIVTTLMLGCAGKNCITGKEPFYLDSGATHHATGNRKLISQMTADKAGTQLKTANGGSLWSHGSGYVITEDYTLANVHYVPGLDTNVVSVSVLINDLNYSLEFTSKGCSIKDGSTNNLVGEGIRGVSGLFELDSLRVPLDRT